MNTPMIEMRCIICNQDGNYKVMYEQNFSEGQITGNIFFRVLLIGISIF